MFFHIIVFSICITYIITPSIIVFYNFCNILERFQIFVSFAKPAYMIFCPASSNTTVTCLSFDPSSIFTTVPSPYLKWLTRSPSPYPSSVPVEEEFLFITSLTLARYGFFSDDVFSGACIARGFINALGCGSSKASSAGLPYCSL